MKDMQIERTERAWRKSLVRPALVSVLLMFISWGIHADEISELMNHGKWTRAKKAAEEKLLENDQDSSLYLTIGICAVNQRNYNEALFYLSKAQNLNSKNPLSPYLKGIIYEETGILSKAEVSFKKAYALTKDKVKKKDIEKHIRTVQERRRELPR